MSKYETVIFDLDGTLVNSLPDVRLALNKMLASYTNKQVPVNVMNSLIGQGARVMIERAFAYVDLMVTANEIDDAIQVYLSFYREKPVVETYIYPHVDTVLNQLVAANYRLAICTNKPFIMTNLILTNLGLAHYFEVISAGDQVQLPKPHGDHLTGILQQMNTSPLTALMVGDSEVDQMTAENAKLDFIGVSYGYSPEKMTPCKMISHFGQLPMCLELRQNHMQKVY